MRGAGVPAVAVAASAAPAAAREARVEEPVVGSAPARRSQRPLITHLEGVPVWEDVHGTPGSAGGYRRFFVRCPLAGGAHEMGGQCGPCAKRRGTGPAQTAGIGPMEPFAYLGVWLRRASDFASRGEHVRYRPSPDTVAAYARERGWLEEA